MATRTERVPRVSIITPTMNQGQFIEETIRSVVDQDYPNIEYIIIDGGSRDQTHEIVKRYRNDIAVFVSEQDSGQSAAINRGIRLSTGDIVLWLNSDDLLMPGAVRTAVEQLQAHPEAGIVCSDFWGLDDASGKRSRWTSAPVDLPTLVERNVIPQPTVFLRRSLLDQIGLVDESLHLTMDWELWLRAARVTQLLYLPGVCLAVLRDHSAAKTRALYGRRVAEHLLILAKLFADPSLPRAVRRRRRVAYSHVYWEAAEHAAIRGRAFPDGIGWLLRSLMMHPAGAMARPRTSLTIAVAAAHQAAHQPALVPLSQIRGALPGLLAWWRGRHARARTVAASPVHAAPPPPDGRVRSACCRPASAAADRT